MIKQGFTISGCVGLWPVQPYEELADAQAVAVLLGQGVGDEEADGLRQLVAAQLQVLQRLEGLAQYLGAQLRAVLLVLCVLAQELVNDVQQLLFGCLVENLARLGRFLLVGRAAGSRRQVVSVRVEDAQGRFWLQTDGRVFACAVVVFGDLFQWDDGFVEWQNVVC